jgi:hypothetical protein
MRNDRGSWQLFVQELRLVIINQYYAAYFYALTPYIISHFL